MCNFFRQCTVYLFILLCRSLSQDNYHVIFKPGCKGELLLIFLIRLIDLLYTLTYYILYIIDILCSLLGFYIRGSETQLWGLPMLCPHFTLVFIWRKNHTLDLTLKTSKSRDSDNFRTEEKSHRVLTYHFNCKLMEI